MSTIPKILIVYFSLAIFTAPSLSFGIEAPKTEYNIEELFQKSCQTPNLTEKQHLREQIVQLSPNSSYGHFCRGWLFQIKSEYDKAEKEYREGGRILNIKYKYGTGGQLLQYKVRPS